MRTVAIVQARMGASRLPAKVLMDVLGQPMLQWVVERSRRAASVDEVVVATTVNSEDEAISQWCAEQGLRCVRGSQDDVLSRYYLAAQASEAEVVVRVTADDPLKDPEIIDQSVALLLGSGADYCSNTITPTFPEGLDIEAFRFQALDVAYREARLPSEREHVTPYIWKNRSKFKVAEFWFERDLSSWRWTVDKPEDIEFIRQLLGAAGANMETSYRKLVDTVDNLPDLLAMCTNKTIRNEGYIKSLNMESL